MCSLLKYLPYYTFHVSPVATCYIAVLSLILRNIILRKVSSNSRAPMFYDIAYRIRWKYYPPNDTVSFLKNMLPDLPVACDKIIQITPLDAGYFILLLSLIDIVIDLLMFTYCFTLIQYFLWAYNDFLILKMSPNNAMVKCF